MVRYSFFVRQDRLPELQQFIKENMPTCRFFGNPIKFRETYYVTLNYEIDDSDKLNELENRWHEIDNPVPPPKVSWLSKIKSWFK